MQSGETTSHFGLSATAPSGRPKVTAISLSLSELRWRKASGDIGLLRGGATSFGSNRTNRVGYGGVLQRDGNSLDAGSVP
jgi:hypothetical protein